ncbi:MAG: twin-arginine translocase TatA/TatE family subunit [Chloroflexi bacterium]|nr:twin-arginine translocase TatA/TatE family subunit [Chloroflexota bacterium]
MPQLGTPELIIIMVIVLLIFGAGKLGTLGGALGKGVRDFRDSMRTDEEEDGESPTPSEPKRTVQPTAVQEADAAEASDGGEQA